MSTEAKMKRWTVREDVLLVPPLMEGDRVKWVEEDGRAVAWIYTEQDARLIAAAPEAHEANVESLCFLEEAWDEWMDGGGDIGGWLMRNHERFNDVLKANRAAIAKAEGDA